jgi:signal transduction histidine kinase
MLRYSTLLFAWLKRVIRDEWHGPADLPRSLTMEWRLIASRWVGILAVGPALPLLNLPPNRVVAAYVILLFGIVYNVVTRWWIQRRPDLFANGYATTVADSVLNIGMVLISGGFGSPFAYVLFTLTISVAMRYGYGPALAMTLLFVGGESVEKWLTQQPPDAAFAFRSGFLFLTTLLASYLRSLRIRAEAALQERLAELERLYADLALAHQELLSLDEAKTNFLANVSHELRTPLTSIRAFSEILLSYTDDEPAQREFLQIITTESERLTRLVNDVLDVSKIESGEMYWREEHIDVASVVDKCTRTFVPLLKQAKLDFVVEISSTLPSISGDADRLQQVIYNLLNNAMKFTSDGTISLRVWVKGDWIHVAVADTGVGIAARDQKRVFEKFQQVGDTLTGKPKGTGLGLTICRDIVAYHGGQMLLDSEPGRGSTFTVLLPVAHAARLAA